MTTSTIRRLNPATLPAPPGYSQLAVALRSKQWLTDDHHRARRRHRRVDAHAPLLRACGPRPARRPRSLEPPPPVQRWSRPVDRVSAGPSRVWHADSGHTRLRASGGERRQHLVRAPGHAGDASQPRRGHHRRAAAAPCATRQKTPRRLCSRRPEATRVTRPVRHYDTAAPNGPMSGVASISSSADRRPTIYDCNSAFSQLTQELDVGVRLAQHLRTPSLHRAERRCSSS